MALPLSIVIPVYNEPENIVPTLAALEEVVPGEKEVLLVYDRDGDTTLPVIERLRAAGQRLTPVRNRYGAGVGNALRTGFDGATGEVVVVVMADGADDLPKVNDMARLIEQGYDVVCGSRYMRGGRQEGGPWLKKLLSRTAGVSLHLLSGIPTRDVTNSFKAYRRGVLASIPLTPAGGFAASMELTVKAWVQGFRLTEVPVTWQERVAGKSRFRFWAWLPHYLRWYFYALLHRPAHPHSGAASGRGESPAELQKIYRHRFTPAEVAQNRRVWEVLCRHFFQRYIPAHATVVDLGAGYCHFINQIAAAKKYAVDLNPDLHAHAGDGVEVVETPSTDLARIPASSVDVVFSSNFFEHLPTQADFVATLGEVRRILGPDGRLLILQPNLRYLGARYWDFPDHHLPFTHQSLPEALERAGFTVEEVVPRFLPYTSKSRLPKAPALVWLYLKLKPAWRLLGKQMFVVARKAAGK